MYVKYLVAWVFCTFVAHLHSTPVSDHHKAKGKIHESLAKAICAAAVKFAESSTLAEPLKDPKDYPKSDGGCKAYYWNICDEAHEGSCSRFLKRSSKCPGTGGSEGNSVNNVIKKQENTKKVSTGTKRNGNTRVIGGTQASDEEMIFIVRLLDTKTQELCGGIILDAKNIITAAHCFGQVTSVTDIVAYAGDLLIDEIDPYEEQRIVSEIIRHETFSSATFQDDIAIVVIKTPLPIYDKIGPPLFPPLDFIAEGHAEFAGWGSQDPQTAERADSLQANFLQLWDLEECKKNLTGKADVRAGNICAGSVGNSPCRGDSGGPLVYRTRNGTFVIGLASHGENPCGGAHPTVFMQIAFYKDWITRHKKP